MRADTLARERANARVERLYTRSLMGLARYIASLCDSMVQDPELLIDALNAYAATVAPWAQVVGARMVREASAADLAVWRRHSREISEGLRELVERTPTGELFQQRLRDQVRLITSMPQEAAQRVSDMMVQARIEGWTTGYLEKRILETGHVTESRARLIARTEVARTSTELARARAETAGSTHYIWRSMEDSRVRPTHAKLNGGVFAWAEPPVCEPDGQRAHPGCIYNCRCVAEPIFPEEGLPPPRRLRNIAP